MAGKLVVLNKDGNTVSVIDAETGDTTTTIETDFNPHEVVVSPDGSKTYVTCSLGGKLNVIDNETFEVTKRIDHEQFKFPHGVATRNSTGDLWLAATYSSHIYRIDTETDEIETVFPTHQDLSHMFAIDADESTGYIANIGSDSVCVVDLDRETITATFSVGAEPEGIAVDEHTGDIYVANQADDSLSVVDSNSYETKYELTLGNNPIRVVPSPDGEYVFVPNRLSDDLSVIDTSVEREVRFTPDREMIEGGTQPWEIKRIPVGVWPGGTVFNDDGSRAFVANNKTNDVSVIDVESLEEIERYDAGLHPDGIDYLPE